MTDKSLSNLANRKVLLGVSGGIAAYKILSLTSKLCQSNAQVEVILTRSAQKLVTPTSFQGFTGKPVRTKMFLAPEEITANHIHLADWADIYVIAPATANTIAKLANGFANNLLTCTALAVQCPIIIVPAMNTNMWNNRIVTNNVQKLKEFGFHFIGPVTGHLACGTNGDGRMVEPENIYDAICDFLNR